MRKVKGIHHVSFIAGHAQRNIDFYVGVLGLRLVKQTLNYDDVTQYHFYFSNHDGSSALTTSFPWNDAQEGKRGAGQVAVIQYAVGRDQLDFWEVRLSSFGIETEITQEKNQKILHFEDPDGLKIELIEMDNAAENTWQFNGIETAQTINGIQAARLLSHQPEKTLDFLQKVGYRISDETEHWIKLNIEEGLGSGLYINKQSEETGRMGIGAVHHIAFKIENESIDEWRQTLIDLGYEPTPVRNRKYFKSLYFKEAGGILIELATEGPGVAVDETVQDLGKALIIPDHFKQYEAEARTQLMPVEVREVHELSGYGYRDYDEYEIFKKRKELLKRINRYARRERERGLSLEEQKELAQLRKAFIEHK